MNAARTDLRNAAGLERALALARQLTKERASSLGPLINLVRRIHCVLLHAQRQGGFYTIPEISKLEFIAEHVQNLITWQPK